MLPQLESGGKVSNHLHELAMQTHYMSEDESKTGKKGKWYRLTLSGPVKNLSASLGHLTYITTLVIKNNSLERLPPEIGNLINLLNLDASHNMLSVVPSTIGNLSSLRALLLNNNRLHQLPLELGLMISLKHLNLSENPLNPDLKTLLGDGSDVRGFVRQHTDWFFGQFMQTRSENFVSFTPPQRQWRNLGHTSKDGFVFTLMCYNILSPKYATRLQYPYCPTWALDWDYRRRTILEEIRTYNASIICLQELETSQFYDVFQPELAKIGYDSLFLAKSRRRSMSEVEGKRVDGCAIFWQVDKFQKMHVFHHEFGISCTNVCEQNSSAVMNRVVCRDNVALGVIFETKASTSDPNIGGNRHLCVTTGHIHWDPEHSDVKLIQTIVWVNELWSKIEQFMSGHVSTAPPPPTSSLMTAAQSSPSLFSTTSASSSTDSSTSKINQAVGQMPVIMCGDFNSLPTSGVVEFLVNGSLAKSHGDFMNNGFKYMLELWNMLDKQAVDGATVRHPFKLDRAYQTPDQGMSTTNYTFDFKGMIDYILFSRDQFRLLGSLDQVSEKWITENQILGCPHVHFPSDHFSLLVELELNPTPALSAYVEHRLKRPASAARVPVSATTTAASAAKHASGEDEVGGEDDDDDKASTRDEEKMVHSE